MYLHKYNIIVHSHTPFPFFFLGLDQLPSRVVDIQKQNAGEELKGMSNLNFRVDP